MKLHGIFLSYYLVMGTATSHFIDTSIKCGVTKICHSEGNSENLRDRIDIYKNYPGLCK
jgi:hypothetical protein